MVCQALSSRTRRQGPWTLLSTKQRYRAAQAAVSFANNVIYTLGCLACLSPACNWNGRLFHLAKAHVLLTFTPAKTPPRIAHFIKSLLYNSLCLLRARTVARVCCPSVLL